jgi:hypothetical protein
MQGMLPCSHRRHVISGGSRQSLPQLNGTFDSGDGPMKQCVLLCTQPCPYFADFENLQKIDGISMGHFHRSMTLIGCVLASMAIHPGGFTVLWVS